ncbi:SRPBCC family protein [Brevibacterium salitolerans]
MLHQHPEPRPGESAPFHFESRWLLDAPAQAIWDAFADPAAWPRWWPGMERTVAPASGTGDGSGARVDLTVRSPLLPGPPAGALRLSLRIVEAAPPRRARVAVRGDLRGHGLWLAHEAGGITRVDIVWCVVTARPLLRLLRPLSGLSHRTVMRGGARGLARELSTRTRR